jgi:recombinational DNA repair protein (RecF pathway)
LQSKLKFGLQDLSFGKFSLVKGREVWRIVGAEESQVFEEIKKDKERLALTAKIFSLIDRLIKGERKDTELFDDIYNAFILINKEELSSDEFSGLELILVYRILHDLGYVSYDSSSAQLVEFKEWERGFLNVDKSLRAKLLKQINDAIAHSHL